ncbi:Homeobox domain-containing protein [Psidium guajava]|nr:Homeobox domain-containing protein [Psidium guajava]
MVLGEEAEESRGRTRKLQFLPLRALSSETPVRRLPSLCGEHPPDDDVPLTIPPKVTLLVSQLRTLSPPFSRASNFMDQQREFRESLRPRTLA